VEGAPALPACFVGRFTLSRMQAGWRVSSDSRPAPSPGCHCQCPPFPTLCRSCLHPKTSACPQHRRLLPLPNSRRWRQRSPSAGRLQSARWRRCRRRPRLRLRTRTAASSSAAGAPTSCRSWRRCCNSLCEAAPSPECPGAGPTHQPGSRGRLQRGRPCGCRTRPLGALRSAAGAAYGHGFSRA
jgi:hypothetical protein